MMRDFLRRTDPVPRLERWRQRQLAAAQDEFFKRHGRPPADGELACTGAAEAGPAAGPQGGEFRRFFQAREIAHDSPDRFHGGPLSSTEREDLKEWVTTGFSRTDRLIIILYYYEHLTMKEIGRTIGCSESRVSQRLVLILKALRARLERTGRAGELET
jgi:RNA polymerase sigma factor (sigma-70 family)